MADDQDRRERVRALVREVLKTALSAEEADEPQRAGTRFETAPRAAAQSSAARENSEPRAVESSARPTTARASALLSAKSPRAEEQPVARDESAKTIITETDVRDLAEGSRLRIAEGARLTPLAADIIRERRIEIVRRTPRRGSRARKLVAIGADHGGFKLKEELKELLAELGHLVRDFGTNSTDAVDYPDFAHAVARAVSDGEADVGIIIDGAGVGSAMTANKVPGVRAAACYSVKVARNSREHNDANVLTLGSGTITSAEMREIVGAWLATEISEERHRKRVAKIEAVERQYCR